MNEDGESGGEKEVQRWSTAAALLPVRSRRKQCDGAQENVWGEAAPLSSAARRNQADEPPEFGQRQAGVEVPVGHERMCAVCPHLVGQLVVVSFVRRLASEHNLSLGVEAPFCRSLCSSGVQRVVPASDEDGGSPRSESSSRGLQLRLGSVLVPHAAERFGGSVHRQMPARTTYPRR